MAERKLTNEERDALIERALKTPEGQLRLRRTLLGGWATWAQAIRFHYVPMLVRKFRRIGQA